MNDIINEKLRKIVELATRGVGGEKINAQRIAERELAKLGMTINEFISDTSIDEYIISYRGKVQRKLLIQIIANVLDNADKFNGIYAKGQKAKVTCSKSEYAEIITKFNVLKKDFESEFDVFFLAFVNRNNLWSNITKYDENNEPSAKEKMRHFRAAQMAQSINQSSIHKQLAEA